MKQRCLNPKQKFYSYYGGRGITICEEWLNFPGFFADMGIRPDGTTLDRIDSDKPYSKDNCRWVDWQTQSINKRKQERNRSGTIGVDIVPNGRFVASIRKDKRKVHLGTYDTLEEATQIRKEAELKYYGFNVNE
jgi:hypothetical protein